MTRTITTHQINWANDKLKIEVVDDPGAGGANHEYVISYEEAGKLDEGYACCLDFQNGPINAKGINGITQEALIAICIDRLQSFQSGPYACRENALALTKLEEAMHWLHHRTLSRMKRGVEGTHTV